MENDNEFELTRCPECAAPAEIVDRFDLRGTDGRVEHVKVLCLQRHWFTIIAPEITTALPGEERSRWTGRAA